MIRSFRRPELAALTPYIASPPPPGIVDLSANESPYPWPETWRNELAAALAGFSPERYPDSSATKVREAFASLHSLSPESVTVGNGSDELIWDLCLAFAGPGTAVVVPEPTFAVYGMAARTLGVEPTVVPLDYGFTMDTSIVNNIRAERRLIFLASPNNPTGNRLDEATVLSLLDDGRNLVVIDEAYIDYSGGIGMLPRLSDRHNLVVLRTLSKVGGAGLRVGFLAAGPCVREAVNLIRQPYNVGSFSQAGARVLLSHWQEVSVTARRVVTTRGIVAARLGRIPGVTVHPSEANFLLLTPDSGTPDLVAGLLDRGYRVKGIHAPQALAGSIRVTIGTEEEMGGFTAALADLLA
jgi:histidinol-phosphate aminotransferase